MPNFSVLSFNAQGKWNLTGHTSFKKIESYLSNQSADIIAIQELCDVEKIFKYSSIKTTYNIFIPKLNKRANNRQRGYNHNILLSKYPILKAGDMEFPQWDKNKILENCIRVDIQIQDKVLRIYNCHFPIFRVGMITRLNQLEYLLSDSKTHVGPVVICGDLNVTIPRIGWKRKIITTWHQIPKRELFINNIFIESDERELFNKTLSEHGFIEAFPIQTPTWSPFKSKIWELFKLKLDWLIVKDLIINKTEMGEYTSDHRPLKIDCSCS